MLGFLFGTVCLVGLVAVLKRHRRRQRYGYSGHCGRGGGRGFRRESFFEEDIDGYRGRGWSEGGDDGFRGSFVMRQVLEHLDTTPGQEKVIREAWKELRDSARSLRGEADKTRGDLASAMRAGYFDETTMGELFARHDTAMDGLRKATVGSLAKVHEALDESQRRKLASLIENGPFRNFR